MSKYHFHYQQIKHNDDKNDPYKVHEAYSLGNSVVMINPKPLQLVAPSKEELEELVSMVEKDVIRHGVLTLKEAQIPMKAFQEFMATDTITSTVSYEDEEYIEEDDFYDENDNVVPIDEYIKRNRY
jgi:hypothetical protein